MHAYHSYSDIFINHSFKTFYIVESSFKPKTCAAALQLMTQIELIVKERFSYNPNRHDVYSNQSQSDLFENLRKKASQIYEHFNLNQIFIRGPKGKYKRKKRQLLKSYNEIQKYVSPSQVFPLPEELIQKIFSYLSVLDFGALAQSSHHGETHAITAIIKRAQEFGYRGRDYTQASKYISNLFRNIHILNNQKLLPEKYVVYKQKIFPQNNMQSKLNVEKVLQNLKTAPTEDLFLIFSNENVHIQSLPEFGEMFALQWKRKATKIKSDEMIKKGEEALFFAAKHINKNILKLLLSLNINLNAEFSNQFTPLTINTRDPDITKMLIAQGASIDHQTTPEGYTALHLATKEGNLETVKVLLAARANPNAIDFKGQTPLHLASLYRKRDVAGELFKYQADPNIAAFDGVTPLTIDTRDPDITKMLIKYGASIDQTNPEGYNVLHFAAQRGDLETVKVLLAADANRNAMSLQGRTPLYLASSEGKENVVKELLKHHADPNIAAFDGFTPLTINTSFPGITEMLIKHGSLIDDQMNPRGNTVLHFAVERNQIETIKVLLKAGADREIRNLNGFTPLELAKNSVVKELLSS